ncbi:hypothetical protein GCM10009668_40290 [Nocardioides dubius]|uniref:Uncharacterized protein n=1 Tax=Nocardioides dubius TaxID=317019 RepID=A0ABN1U2L6_9ACTN
MIRRSARHRSGVYRRDGPLAFGRSPFITEAERAHIANPTHLTRVLQRLGLVYRPDGRRRALFGRTSTD